MQKVDKSSELKRLHDLLLYDPVKGTLTSIRNSRVLVPDEDGIVTVYDPDAKVKTKKYKLDKLVYYFIHGVWIDKNLRILHKNLDKTDNTLQNLQAVTREEYLQVQNAYKNLDGGIRYVQHPSDQYCFKVYWYEGSAEKSKVVQDVVTAKKLEFALRFHYMKILTKYCIFDEE